ncbi:MAG: FeoA family protein [Eubacteriales bacterium]|nr:FeoA family protein [Eubacteriales bacterium]
MEKTALNRLKPGMRGQIDALTAQGLLRRRLMDLGLMPGATVEMLQAAPFGDPTAYRVRGAVIALRAADAARITVILPA